MYNLDSIELPR